MAIDIETCRPKLGNIVGGLSGPAIKPLALRMVWQASMSVSIPVVGIGGISTAADAIEFMLAGATAIQVGTANFINPKATEEIIHGIGQYLQARKMESVKDLIGSMQISRESY
jgi:dihydroorotate dehydrogenase (NAD+) catalytic subunit